MIEFVGVQIGTRLNARTDLFLSLPDEDAAHCRATEIDVKNGCSLNLQRIAFEFLESHMIPADLRLVPAEVDLRDKRGAVEAVSPRVGNFGVKGGFSVAN